MSRSLRPRPAHSAPAMSDLETSSSDEYPSDDFTSTIKVPTRSSNRTARKRYSERESSDDASTSGPSRVSHRLRSSRPNEYSPLVAAVSHPLPDRPSHSSCKRLRSSKRQYTSGKKRKLNVPARTTTSSVVDTQVTSCHKIPPWQVLEYEILLKIFKYAAFPLYGRMSHSQPSINWLLDISRLCRSFHDAALSGLLHSPPLFPSWRAHRLIALLEQEQGNLSINYRTKIKRLDVEAKNLLVRKSGINLEQLVSLTPLLDSLVIYHNHDEVDPPTIWSQPSARKLKWSYPTSLFDTLNEAGVALQSFAWNGRFPDARQVVHDIGDMQSRTCLQSLQSLSLFNLTMEKVKEETRIEYGSILSRALSNLPRLRDLTIERCDGLLSPAVLSRFPHDLQRLSLRNCSGLTSMAVSTFLQHHGLNLQSLILHGNQMMDLGFMPELEVLCSQLIELSIDLTYQDPSSYHDTEPLYDELLPNGQPTWPESIQSVKLANLRRLEASDADDFFESLIKAAPRLSHLRRLEIKAILKIAWKERASFRSKWLNRFQKTYLRAWTPPQAFGTPPHARAPQPVESPHRKGRHRKLAKDRKSTRIAQKEIDKSAHADVDAEATQDVPFVQGMCDVVSFRVDDSRPAEQQFHEGDFVDSESDGDEDWVVNGDSG